MSNDIAGDARLARRRRNAREHSLIVSAQNETEVLGTTESFPRSTDMGTVRRGKIRRQLQAQVLRYWDELLSDGRRVSERLLNSTLERADTLVPVMARDNSTAWQSRQRQTR